MTDPSHTLASCRARVTMSTTGRPEITVVATALTGRHVRWRMLPADLGGYWICGDTHGTNIANVALRTLGFTAFSANRRAALRASHDLPGLTIAAAAEVEGKWIDADVFRGMVQ